MAKSLIRKSNSVSQGRSFTSVQMVHTHAPLPRGWLRPRRVRWRWRWRKDGNEMTMKMRWKFSYPEHERGNAKEERKEEQTPAPTHLAHNGQTLKGQGKRKGGRTTGKHQPAEGGRTEAPDTTYKARANAYLGTRRTQTWPREESAHEIGDHGELVDEIRCIHITCIFRDNAQRPSAFSCHNPVNGLSCQPLNYVHNWTSPTTIKRKNHQTCRNVLMPPHGHMSCCRMSSSVLSWAVLKNRCCRGFQLAAGYSGDTLTPKKGESLVQREAVSTQTRPTGEKPKGERLFHLNELLIQKCKFRGRFKVSRL